MTYFIDLLILDFGFARNVEKGVNLSDRCGTTQYMAPEIVRGDLTYDAKSSDIWSL